MTSPARSTLKVSRSFFQSDRLSPRRHLHLGPLLAGRILRRQPLPRPHLPSQAFRWRQLGPPLLLHRHRKPRAEFRLIILSFRCLAPVVNCMAGPATLAEPVIQMATVMEMGMATETGPVTVTATQSHPFLR